MTTYVGETLVIVAEVRDDRDRPLDPPPAQVVAEFWAPDLNPERDPIVRATPTHGPYSLTMRPGTDEWAGDIDTSDAGWAAGRWTCRVTASDAWRNWEFFTFDLKE